MIFAYFGIPRPLQHRTLFYGILGALLLRGIFILIGLSLIQYEWVLITFGLFLIITGVKMAFTRDRQPDLENNLVLRCLQRALPLTPALAGGRFFVRAGGAIRATPLLLTLGLIEVTDVMFAIDSVPAVFAVTQELLIVFTSNVFAILGLRSLYFLIAGAVARFHLLRYAVGAILVFVGLKASLLNVLWQHEFPTAISLMVIGALLALGIGLSVAFPKSDVSSGSPDAVRRPLSAGLSRGTTD
jgi:tellurite resistance protein TerC